MWPSHSRRRPHAHPVVHALCWQGHLPGTDLFSLSSGSAGLVATELRYWKEEEIFGEDEPSEYVYQVVSGAVRSRKLLSDGRRRIGAFYLPGGWKLAPHTASPLKP